MSYCEHNQEPLTCYRCIDKRTAASRAHPARRDFTAVRNSFMMKIANHALCKPPAGGCGRWYSADEWVPHRRGEGGVIEWQCRRQFKFSDGSEDAPGGCRGWTVHPMTIVTYDIEINSDRWEQSIHGEADLFYPARTQRPRIDDELSLEIIRATLAEGDPFE